MKKNEKSPLVAIHSKYSFRNIAETAYKILSAELSETLTQGITEIEEARQETSYVFNTDENDEYHMLLCKRENDQCSITSLSKGYEPVQQKNVGVQYYKVDFKKVLGHIEEQTARNKFIEELQQIKKKNSHSGVRMRNFDFSSMKNRAIEDLLVQQKAKGITRNLMSYFVVGDLMARNNEMFKFYEKNEYYTHLKHTQNINDIQILKSSSGEEHETLSTNGSSEQLTCISFSSFLNVAKDNFKDFKKNIDRFEVNMIKKYVKNFYICCEE